jgi:NAD(P)-dependent dehydrogenase (short-subunit alcohol dehydrogenase family)
MKNALYDVSQKLVVITGGGTGLGFTMSKFFSEAGARIVMTGRREHILREAGERLGENVGYIVNDITKLDALPQLVSSVETQFGAIDVLINNSGINLKKHFLETTDEEFQQIIQTNLAGVFALTRAVAQKMKERKSGSIILITSMAALYGIPNVSAYTSSKSAILGLTRALAVDLSPFGIRINSIAPGFIDTPMLQKAFDSDPERKRKVLERTPMRRLGTPEDVASAALFLASDASRFITGINLPVDGGNSIGF